MLSKRYFGFLTLLAFGATPWQAFADYGVTEDYARVVSARPIYRTVESRVPQERCWSETVREEAPRENSPTGAIVGGVVGAALGRSVGHGSDNKKIGTAAGAVLGAVVGNQVGKNQSGSQDVTYRERERCQTSQTYQQRQEITGYDVEYQYMGKTYSSRMDYDPGNRVRVAVRVEPIQ